MKIQFDLYKNQRCQLEVIGSDIFDESIEYSDSITINTLYKVNSKEEEILIKIDSNKHIIEDGVQDYDISIFNLEEDGLYKIEHFIIPTLEWIEKTQDFSEYQMIYVTDGDRFYKYYNQELEEVQLEEILEVNSEYCNFKKDNVYTFSTCNLYTCYYNICRKLLLEYCGQNCVKSNSDSYNRDLLWMAINTINYLVEKGSFFEAQRILEIVSDCHGLCNQKSKNKGEKGCGCHTNS